MWLEQWASISARIAGLLNAGNLMALTMTGSNRFDEFNVGQKWIGPALETLIKELRSFAEQHSAALPQAAADALQKFLATVVSGHGSDSTGPIQAIVPFAIFRTEFEYIIQDVELEKRTLTELAFEHLSRLLAVDTEVRTKWVKAFRHETKCEKLGAVHLMIHGIWAFKVSTSGSATDIVFPEPIESQAVTVRRTARALVLTEWKLIKTQKDVERKAAVARRQARLYSGGVLADLSLNNTRYVVLVSRPRLPVPPDIQEGGITYRHIGIAIEPDTSSVEARIALPKTRSRGLARRGNAAQS